MVVGILQNQDSRSADQPHPPANVDSETEDCTQAQIPPHNDGRGEVCEGGGTGTLGAARVRQGCLNDLKEWAAVHVLQLGTGAAEVDDVGAVYKDERGEPAKVVHIDGAEEYVEGVTGHEAGDGHRTARWKSDKNDDSRDCGHGESDLNDSVSPNGKVSKRHESQDDQDLLQEKHVGAGAKRF